MNREIAAHHGAFTGALSHTDLTNDNLTVLDLLAAINFDAEPLAGTIMNVFT